MQPTPPYDFPAKATQAQTRAHNASLVLRALYDLGPISRADISRLMGVTRTSAGELVSELEREGLAENIGRGPSTGGKAPTLFALVDDARHLVSLDLGERTFTAALVNLRGAIRRRATREMDGGDVDSAVALVIDLIDEVMAGEHAQILGISVGTPGLVERDGTIRWALNLSLGDLALGDILRARYHLPTIVANDAWAATLATYLFRKDRRPSSLVAIKVGNGIGGGLVLNGQLFEGDRRGAGEIGHIVVDADGAVCHCGRRGCLETVASAPAILRAAAASSVRAKTLADLGALASGGDPAALAVVASAGSALGIAIAHVVGVLDVTEILVHGSVTALGEPWLRAIRGEANTRSLGPLIRETRVVDGGLGEDLTLLGAAAMLLTSELGLTVHR
ncbi:MAG: ROK family transcriptional regulator [Chloroflexota bacterium]